MDQGSMFCTFPQFFAFAVLLMMHKSERQSFITANMENKLSGEGTFTVPVNPLTNPRFL